MSNLICKIKHEKNRVYLLVFTFFVFIFLMNPFYSSVSLCFPLYNLIQFKFYIIYII